MINTLFRNLQSTADKHPKASLLVLVLLLSLCDILLVRDFGSITEQIKSQRFWVNIALSYLCLLLFLYSTLPIKSAFLRRLTIALILIPQAVQLSYFATYKNFISLFDVYFLFQDTALAFKLGAENTPWLSILLLLIVELPILLIVFKLPLKPYRISRAINGFLAMAFFAVITLSWYSTAKFQFSSVSFWSLVPALIERYALEADNKIEKPKLTYKQNADKNSPNLIFVVGESLNALNMNLYGYPRHTTPKLNELAQSKNLLAFKNAVSIGTRTISSVPHMLTGFQSIDPTGKIYSMPTIFNYAKSAGYYTGLITAQELKWRNLDQLLVDKDVDVYQNGTDFSSKVDVLMGADDMDVLNKGVLPFMEQAKKTGKPYLLVIQMNGSHYPYNLHSPKSIKQFFPEDDPNGLNAYDNTVLYSDLVLSTLFKSIKNPENTWMFYSSDHGQGVTAETSSFNRGFKKQIVYNPLLVFSSTNNIEKVIKNEHKPVSQADVFYTLLGLMKFKPVTTVSGIDLQKDIPENRLRIISRYTKILHNDPHVAVVLPNRDLIKIDFEKQNALLPDGKTLIPYSQLPKAYQDVAESKVFNFIDNQQPYKKP